MSQAPTVLLVWEDRQFTRLGLLMRKARHLMGGPHHVVIEDESAQGNAGFARYITQRLVLPSPRRGQLSPRFIIAVADADRYETLVPGFSAPPQARKEQARWSYELRRNWTRTLRDAAAKGGVEKPQRIFGIPLRWCRESVIIASLEAVREWAGPRHAAQLQDFLSRCKPDPRTLPDIDFAHTYRKPGACLGGFAREIGRPGGFKKGIDGEDVLGTQAAQQSAELKRILARVPELRVLVRLINRLARWA